MTMRRCFSYLLPAWLMAATLASAESGPADAGPDSLRAMARYERFRRVVIDLAGPAQLAGEKAVAREGKKILGEARFSGGDTLATATIILPMPAIGQSYGPIQIKAGSRKTSVTLPDTTLARHEALCSKQVRFWPSYVFDREQFPGCDFEDPAAVEDLIGRYTITLRYLDAHGNEVTKAEAPGRYGAIAEIQGEAGHITHRYATLYRTEKPMRWQMGGGPAASVSLPAELGIAPEIAMVRAGEINTFFRDAAIRGLLSESDGGAALLAGLSEAKTGDAAGYADANAEWWFDQRKRQGLIQHRYEMDLPQGYADNAERRYPLLVFLHGAGESGLDVAKVRTHGPWKFLKEHPEYECILVGPQCDPYGSPTGTWTGQVREVNDLIGQMVEHYRVDESRIYITGLSLGGFGTYAVTSAFPERFAAAAPICAGGKPEEVARMKSVPTWAFHGAKDNVVPLSWGQRAVDALKEAGGEVRFTIYPEADHDSWTETYRNPEFYEWLFSQKRNSEK